MIGSAAVPSAITFPPRATISADADSPVPGAPLITVPASIVSVCPSFTKTNPSRIQTLSFVQVKLVAPIPSAPSATRKAALPVAASVASV